MNKVFSKVWNVALGQLVVASELACMTAKGGSKGVKRPGRKLLAFTVLAVAMGLASPVWAQTAVSGTGNQGTADPGSCGLGYVDRENPGNPGNPIYQNGYWIFVYNPCSTAVGDNAYANQGGVAIGDRASAEQAGVAIGAGATQTGNSATAIGPVAFASGNTAIAIGRQSAGIGDYSIALGNVSWAEGDSSIAVGHSAHAVGYRSIAIGGGDSHAAANDGVSNGASYLAASQTLAQGDGALAFGNGARAIGDNTTALGNASVANNIGDVALGWNSTTSAPSTGPYSINGGTIAATTDTNGVVSVGTAGKERQIQNVAAGTVSATSTDAVNGSQLYAVGASLNNLGNSVAAGLGGASTYDSSTGAVTTSLDVDGTTYTNVNSALSAVATHYYSVNDTNPYGGTYTGNYNNDGATGGGAIAAGAGASAPANGSIAIGTNAQTKGPTTVGGVTAMGASIAIGQAAVAGNSGTTNAQSVAIGYQASALSTNTVNGSSPVALGTAANADGTGSQVAIGDTSTASGMNAVAIGGSAYASASTTASGDQSVAIGPAAQTDSSAAGGVAIGENAVVKSTGADTNVALGANSTADGSTLSTSAYNPGTGVLAGTAPAGEVSVGSSGNERRITNVAAGANPTDAVNVSQLQSVAAKANAGWNVSAGGGTAAQVKPGDNVDFSNTDGNVEIAQSDAGTDHNLTVDLADDINVTSVTAGNTVIDNTGVTINGGTNPVSLTNTGLNNGGNTITNVASGGTTTTNAANIGDVQAAAAAATTEVAAGTNVASVAKTTAADGHSVYTVNADGANVSAGSGAVTVTQGTPDANNVTDYAVDLSTATKTTLANAVQYDDGTHSSVTLGNAGTPVTVTNVAAGNVADGSTDAVNGDQLYDVQQLASQGWNVGANGATPTQVKPGDNVDFSNTDGNVEIAQTDAGTDHNLTVDLADDINVTSVTTGNTVINNTGVTINGGTNPVSLTNTGLNNGGNTITNVADGVNDDDAATVGQVTAAAAAATTEVQAGTNVANVTKTTAADGHSVYTVNADGASVSAGSSAVSVTAGTPDANNVTDYAVDLSTATKTTLANAVQYDDGTHSSVTLGGTGATTPVTVTNVAAGNVADGSTDAVNGDQLYDVQQLASQGWNVGSNGAAPTQVKPGDNVDFSNTDGNVVIGQADSTGQHDLTVDLANDLAVDSVTTGNTVINNTGVTINGGTNPVSLTNTGLDNGGNTITNVADGVNDDDAATVGQVTAAAAAATTEVQAGTNVANVAKTTAADGHAVYTVNADGASVSAGSSAVSVTQGTPDANNVTDYAVDLSQTTKNSLAKADSALQSFVTQADGATAQTVDQNNPTANFKSGSNIQLSGDATGITVATKDDVTFNSVTSNTVTAGPVIIDGASGTITGLTNTAPVDPTDPNFDPSQAASQGQLADVAATAGEGWNVSAAGGTVAQVKPGDNVDFSNTDGNVEIAQTDAGTDHNLTVDLADDINVTSVTAGNTVINNSGVTINGGTNPVSLTNTGLSNGGNTITNVADGVNDDDAATVGQVTAAAAAAATEVQAGTNVANVTKTTAADGHSVYTVNADGASVSAGSSAVSVTAGTPDANNVTDYAVDLSTATKTRLDNAVQYDDGTHTSVTLGGAGATAPVTVTNVAAGNVADGSTDAVNGDQLYDVQQLASQGWNVGANGATPTQVKPGDNVDFSNTDGNVEIAQTDAGTDHNLTVDLADDINVTSVTAGNTVINNSGVTINGGTNPVSLTNTGLNNGGNTITNVADGVNDDDAATVGQVTAAAAAATTEVQAGTNVADVTKTTAADGHSVYTVNADGASVSAGSSAVEVTQGSPDADNVTDYAVDLSQQTKDSLAKADNSVQYDDAGHTSVTLGGTSATAPVKLTNVANGDVSATSTDAVNGSQLNATNTVVQNLGNSTVNVLGGNASYDPATGTVTMSDIGGTGEDNINDAIASANNAANAGWNVADANGNSNNIGPNGKVTFAGDSNVTVTESGTDDDAQVQVALNRNIQVDSVTLGTNGPVLGNDGNGNVKVGDAGGNPVKITNVADGADANDAVNKGQLDAVSATANAGWNVGTNGAAPTQVKPGDNVDFSNTDGNVEIAQTDAGTDHNLTVDLADDINVTSVTAGNTVINNGGVTINGGTNPVSLTNTGLNNGGNTITNVADGVNDDDAATVGQVTAAAAAATTEVQAGTNVANVAKTTAADGHSVYTVNADGASVSAGSGAVTVTQGTPDANNVTDYAVDLSTATKTALANAVQYDDGTHTSVTLGGAGATAPVAVTNVADGDVSASSTDAINGSQLYDVQQAANAGWNVADANGNSNNIGPNGKVTFEGDSNIAVTESGADDDGKVTVALNRDLDLDSVTTGNTVINNGGVTINGGTNPVSLTNTGLNNGGNVITNVASGGTTTTNAANIGDVQAAAAAATTEVVAGTNVASVTKATAADGHATYTVNADGASVSAGSSAVSVTKGTPDANNVTDYAVDLSTATKTTLANAVQYDDGTHSSVTLGNAGTPVAVTNVADGDVSASSTDAVNGSQLYDVQQAANAGWNVADANGNSNNIGPNGKVTFEGDSNVTVTESGTDDDGKVAVALNRDLDLDSVTTGNTVMNNDGLTVDDGAGNSTTITTAGTVVTDGTHTTTYGADGLAIAGGPVISSAGIDAGGKKITHVADGEVSATSTDAVNGSQLNATNTVVKDLGNSTVNVLGGNASYDPATGTVTMSNIGGTGEDNINDAIASANNAANAGWNLTAQGANSSNVGPNEAVDLNSSDGNIVVSKTAASNDVTFDLADDITVDSISLGNDIRIDTTGLFIANGPSISVSGIDAGGLKITHVAPGTAPTDAVNKSQLDAVSDDVQQLADNAVQYDDSSKDGITLGGAKSTDGGKTGGTRISNVHRGDVSADSTDAVNGSQLYETNQKVADNSDAIQNIQNGQGGYFQVNDTSKKGKPAASGKDATAGGAGAVASADHSTAVGSGAEAKGKNSVALGAGSVASRADAVSVGSADRNRQVTHVAPGTEGTDAVNVNQLDAGMNQVTNWAKNYTDKRFNALGRDLNQVNRRANAGVAAAMAMASLPQAYQPDQNAAAVALGNFHGESAIAVGVSTITDSGHYVFKLNATANTRGDTGVGVGAAIVW